MGWLGILLGRWVSGERLRKATSEDYRIWFGYLFTAGVLMAVGPALGRHFLEHASGLVLWIYFVVVATSLAFGVLLWRFVPAVISLVLAIITWGTVVWMYVR
jgi:hypothetical protein